LGRRFLKALIRHKTEELQANASQKVEQTDPDQCFDNQTRKEGTAAIHSKRRKSITLSAYLPDKEDVFPTKEFIVEIINDIKTAKKSGPQDSKVGIYRLRRLRIKPILANLKTDILKEIIKFKHSLYIIDSLKFNDGALLVSDKHIIFRLNFETQAMYSVVLNRKGHTVNFYSLPKRKIENQKQKMATLKFIEPQKIRALEKRFYKNLINSLDFKAEEDMLKEIFGIQSSAKGTFIDGRMIRKRKEVFIEIAAVTKFKFSLIMDLYGNYFDITPNDSSSDWRSLLQESLHRGGFFPAINVFHSNMDCLF
jgi:hypothetical protein